MIENLMQQSSWYRLVVDLTGKCVFKEGLDELISRPPDIPIIYLFIVRY